MQQPKYLYWRGRSLWSRYPVEGFPACYPLGIFSVNGSESDRKRCWKLGIDILSSLRTKTIENGKFFVINKESTYDPKVWRIIGMYYKHRLLSSRKEFKTRWIINSLVSVFGSRRLSELKTSQIEDWLDTLKTLKGKTVSVATRNIYIGFLHGAFSWFYARKKKDGEPISIPDPTINLKQSSGANIRTFLLTEEIFQRNYAWLERNHPDLALFYLAGWETGRRPGELSTYKWSDIGFRRDCYNNVYRVFTVPVENSKTYSHDEVILSGRLENALDSIPVEKRTGLIFKKYRHRGEERWTRGNYKSIWDRLKREAEAAGYNPGVLRDFRRGYITRACEERGHDASSVMQATGHRTISCFTRYRISKKENVIRINKPELYSTGAHTNLIQFPKTA